MNSRETVIPFGNNDQVLWGRIGLEFVVANGFRGSGATLI
jgi:hypothetical protein